ncbi:hypothetical protein DPMN_102251 [Dreissena polymorpha]|uniref:ShKT domain-containing protein n=1 Tax=Dreissena polymorpha TaxID=45954 RepID=A0A9D4LL31_DREPO|nr:hypothetical protein DPMN_102251 [Dreissena polymorpha]
MRYFEADSFVGMATFLLLICFAFTYTLANTTSPAASAIANIEETRAPLALKDYLQDTGKEFLLRMILNPSLIACISHVNAACADIDVTACRQQAAADPNMCQDPVLSTTACPNYCKKCRKCTPNYKCYVHDH